MRTYLSVWVSMVVVCSTLAQTTQPTSISKTVLDRFDRTTATLDKRLDLEPRQREALSATLQQQRATLEEQAVRLDQILRDADIAIVSALTPAQRDRWATLGDVARDDRATVFRSTVVADPAVLIRAIQALPLPAERRAAVMLAIATAHDRAEQEVPTSQPTSRPTTQPTTMPARVVTAERSKHLETLLAELETILTDDEALQIGLK
jgi:hypothetical protein